jgi:hypothetical protein
MKNDYEIEFVFRSLTKDEALKKAGEIHDFLFLTDPKIEFEMFVMEIQPETEIGLPGLEHISHWPEDAKGPFGDLTWDKDSDQ